MRQIELNFYPSFHNSSTIKLNDDEISIEIHPDFQSYQGLDKKEKLKVAEYKRLKELKLYNENAQNQYWLEKVSIDLKVKSALDDISDLAQDLLENPELDERILLDGINVKCTLKNGNFSYRSPQNQSRTFELTNKSLSLLYRVLKSEQSINYLEKIEGYFDISLPWKISSKNPFIFRIYGSLSINEKEALEKEFKSFPNEALVLDFRNFESMGTALYQSFKFIKSKNIIWLADINNGWTMKHLNGIGVERKNITDKIEVAIKKVNQINKNNGA